MICKFAPTNYVHAAKPEKRFHRCTRAECGRGVFLGPLQKAGRVVCGHPSIGAGDVVAKAAKTLGIKPTKNCNCEKRRKLLNELAPSIPKPSWLSWLQGRVNRILPEAAVYAPVGGSLWNKIFNRRRAAQ